MDSIRISGKDLGALAMPGFCERCFWIQRHAVGGLPFQIFPGIFSSIDSYTKKVVHSCFDRNKRAPQWLGGIPDIVTYLDPPHYTKFSYSDASIGVTLRGTPDAVFKLRDGSLLIADYKTAKFTEHQDQLLPVYETQLNSYAYIADHIRYGKVTKLALIYTEPITDEQTANNDGVNHTHGFTMGFSANILPVKLNVGMIPGLLRRVKDIISNQKAPLGKAGCTDCEKLAGIIKLVP
jgi:hypothetical protein